MGKYPEHEKLAARQSERKAIQAFLNWVVENDRYRLRIEEHHDPNPDVSFEKEEDRWWPVPSTIELNRIIEEHFDLDHEVLEREREQMIEEIRGEADE